MPELEASEMREFFSSLYAKGGVAAKVDYDKSVHRLVARIGGNTAAADQALQTLGFAQKQLYISEVGQGYRV